MLTRIFYCCVLFLLAISNTFAASTSATFDYTYVSVTNNTNENLQLNTTLATADKDFKRGRDWEGSSLTLAPYETKEVLWFSRNTNVKADQLYRFNVSVNHSEYPEPIQFSFQKKVNLFMVRK